MGARRSYRLSTILSVLLGIVCASTLATEQPQRSTEELVELLQTGGYVVYLRHSITNHTQQDTDLSDFSKCKNQRNLSTEGKEQAVNLGKQLINLNIPIGQVYSSPYCRCVDTAKLVFDKVKIDPLLRASFNENKATTHQLNSKLSRYLSKQPEPNTNNFVVSHTANLRELTKIWPKPEGVMHIFRPTGEAKFEHIGAIKPDDWLSNVIDEN